METTLPTHLLVLLPEKLFVHHPDLVSDLLLRLLTLELQVVQLDLLGLLVRLQHLLNLHLLLPLLLHSQTHTHVTGTVLLHTQLTIHVLIEVVLHLGLAHPL
jgi:hypothetical protein